jgi:hypothetical protein
VQPGRLAERPSRALRAETMDETSGVMVSKSHIPNGDCMRYSSMLHDAHDISDQVRHIPR